MRIIGAILFVLTFLVALAIGAQNQEVVNFNYLIAQGEFKQSILLGIVFGTGFALGWLICGILYLKARMTSSMLRNQVNKQSQEIKKLRSDLTKE